MTFLPDISLKRGVFFSLSLWIPEKCKKGGYRILKRGCVNNYNFLRARINMHIKRKRALLYALGNSA